MGANDQTKDGQTPDPEELDSTSDGTTEGDGEGDESVPAGGDLAKALRAERGKRKELAAKLKAKDDEIAKIKPLADEYQGLLPHLPGILANAEKGAKAGTTKPTDAAPDPELVAIAEDMGLYDAAGNPDTAKAQRVIQRLDRRASAIAGTTVEPVRKEALTATATQLKEKAFKAVDKDGKPFAKREIIEQVFAGLDPAFLSNPENVSIALLMARGLGGPGEEPVEPLHVESGGRAPSHAPTPMTDLERGIARLRGKTDADWQKAQKSNNDDSDWVVE